MLLNPNWKFTPLTFASASARLPLTNRQATFQKPLISIRPVMVDAAVVNKKVEWLQVSAHEPDAVVTIRYQVQNAKSQWVDVLPKPEVIGTHMFGEANFKPPVTDGFRAHIDVYSFDGKQHNASVTIDVAKK